LTQGEALMSGPTILVVDDHVENRELYVEYLEFHRFRVLQAGDGNEALAIAQAELPDAILMDLALPRLDGWKATRLLKENPRTRAIPVVALTGHALAVHLARATEVGCVRVLTKPALPEAVLRALREVLPRRGARPRAS
jgi:two-component system cell cycle response regulator DivK